MAEISETRSQLRRLSSDGDDNTDFISQLPDSLLCQILSLLPTKMAVLTSILSKRWRLLWTFLPNLDLDDEMPSFKRHDDNTQREEGSQAFSQFVYAVLLQNQTRPLKRCRLKCIYPSCNEFNINAWVNAVTRRNVEHFELYIPCSKYIALPRSLFNCNTLVVLKLNKLYLNSLESFSICLPLLKVLHLGDDVFIRCHDSILKLLCGCPILEVLSLESLHNLMCGGRMCESNNFEISFPHLEEAKLGFYWIDRCHKSLFKIFNALFDVQRLSVALPTSKCLAYASASDIPVFNNLVQLEITLGLHTRHLLPKLLQKSHRLEVLIVHKEFYCYKNGPEPRWTHPVPVPECLLLHLKTFCLTECQGLECELELVGYILKNAMVLETMTIYIDGTLNFEARLQIRRSLSALPRSSETCQLLIY